VASPRTALVVGAGVAGCWMTPALLDRGVAVSLIEQTDVCRRQG
jgi:glycerol-3-phosphate dehydrogenase